MFNKDKGALDLTGKIEKKGGRAEEEEREIN